MAMASPALRSGGIYHVVNAVAPRRLTNPFMAFADDLDSASEEKEAPHHWQGLLYVMLTPWLGLGICLLGFPVLWWNERRATGRRGKPTPAPAAGSPTVKGTASTEKGSAEGTVVQGEVVASGSRGTEGQSLLRPEEAYESVVEGFEDRHCSYQCCKAVRRCFDAMPELDGIGDARTYCFRVLGVTMIFVGVDMIFSPMYFMLHTLWFFGFIVAGHLALCACKFSCLSSCCTMLTSYVIHRPALVALLVVSFLSVSGLSVYYNVPVHGAAR